MVTTQEMLEAVKEHCGTPSISIKVNTESAMDKIWQLIMAERQCQIVKWGKQAHTDGIWLLILTEELGEASKALLAGDHLCGIEELVQSAAVIMAWIEDILEKADSALHAA